MRGGGPESLVSQKDRLKMLRLNERKIHDTSVDFNK